MSKVRLYHLAREWELPEQSMLEVLHEAGHRHKSHFSEVDVQEIPGIRAVLEDGGMFEPPAAEVPPPAAAPVEAAPVAVQTPAPAPEPVVAKPEPTPPPVAETVEPAASASTKAPEPAAAKTSGRAPAAKTSERVPAVKTSGRNKAQPAAAAPVAPTPAPVVEPVKPVAAPTPAPVAAVAAPAPTPVAAPAAPAKPPVEVRPAATAAPTVTPPAPVAAPAAKAPTGPTPPQVSKVPGGPPGGGPPLGVAAGFRGFAPGFDPSARRPQRTGGPLVPMGRGGPPGVMPGGRTDSTRDRGSRFGGVSISPGAGPPDRAPGRGPPPGGPGGPGGLDGPGGAPAGEGEGDDRRRGRGAAARTAVSPAKRGKQATRRSGGQAELGRGRRLEQRLVERERWQKVGKKRPKRAGTANVARPDKVEIVLPISVKDLSGELAIRIPEIMGFFMKQGIMVNANQPVPKEAIELLGIQFGISLEVVDEKDYGRELAQESEEVIDESKLVPRQPIVTVMGHVDHGKTTLLDTIRKTKAPVAAEEAGGITQHVGAYVAEHQGKSITFIDTPGHEAFTEMRSRGANVTDIVLLVIAADDGVMPQTKEAIQHAQAAKAHIMVAVNKMDKKDATTQKILQQLAQIDGMLPTEYGGEVEVVPVSALTGMGVDKLLETILTYAEIMEFKADPTRAAWGTVLEAKKTVGRGVVVTAIVEDGTLRKSDPILAGRMATRVRMMFNDRGKPVPEVAPGNPVEILGFDDVPEVGERFYVVEDEDELAEIIAERNRKAADKAVESTIPTDYAGVIQKLADKEIKEVRVVLKADTQGSLQVLKKEITALATDEVRCKIIRDGVGGITTADVSLAFAERSGAVVICGFGVAVETKARALAKEKGVDIRTHTIIYDLLNDMKDVMGGALEPEERENVLGQVLVRKVFRSSKLGNIAGCFVEQGICRRNASVRLSRDGIVRWQGELDSLRRFKDDVKEVRENFECGLKLKGFDDLKEGDRLEVFEIQKIKRTLE